MVEKYNEEIQALRAIAVMAVVIHHLSGLFFWNTAKWDSIGQGLWVGVDLFFCISGYVIAKSFLPRVIDKSGTEFWREVGAFWLRCIYRITPTVWFWMLIVMLAAPMFSFLGTKGFSSRNLAEAAAVMMHVENFHAFECVSDPNKCGGNPPDFHRPEK